MLNTLWGHARSVEHTGPSVGHTPGGSRILGARRRRAAPLCTCLRFGVWGLGFGVWGLGFGVWGLKFGVLGLGFWVWGLRFGVQGEEIRALG